MLTQTTKVDCKGRTEIEVNDAAIQAFNQMHPFTRETYGVLCLALKALEPKQLAGAPILPVETYPVPCPRYFIGPSTGLKRVKPDMPHTCVYRNDLPHIEAILRRDARRHFKSHNVDTVVREIPPGRFNLNYLLHDMVEFHVWLVNTTALDAQRRNA